MDVTYSQISTRGPVRPKNEDYLGFWQPDDPELRRTLGTVVIVADGVGGQGGGDIASRLAVETALERFKKLPTGAAATHLRQIIDAANLAVYDASMQQRDKHRMGTTLTISILRNEEIAIGHVGDCRAYLIRQGRISRLTNDHSYAGMQAKMGLISTHDAMLSDLRSVLTRSVGQDPIVRPDFHSTIVTRGDILVQCCDGLYCNVSEGELLDLVSKNPPDEACRKIIELAERRNADDNLSIQIVRIDGVERLTYYRGLPIYQKVPDVLMGTEPQAGQALDGRFQIIDTISRSGMATIYKATDTRTGRVVALKVPFMQFESDPGFFSRFEREEQIGKKLSHPYILRVENIDDVEKSRPYLVMEYLEGQTLGNLMRTVRPLPEADALKIASRLCDALRYMHEHDVVHRDLKPDNIMVCNDGTLRIMDFGIAKVEGVRRLTFGGFTPAMGTPDYMAPEQVKGKRGDARTDIYSLGAILYEMATGQVPFEGANAFGIMNARLSGDPKAPRQVNPELSPQVEEIILHAMSRNPADRYGSAEAMKVELEHPESVTVTGRADRVVAPAEWRGHWRSWRMLLLGVLIPLLAIAAIYLVSHLRWK